MKNKMNRKKCTPLNCSQSIELLTSRVRVRPSFQVVSEASGSSARVSGRPSFVRLNNNNFKIHHPPPPTPYTQILFKMLFCQEHLQTIVYAFF